MSQTDRPALPPAVEEFWALARTANPEIDADRLVGAFAFDDNPEGATLCAAAVLSGQKTATSALASDFGPGRRAPRPGELEIVTEFDGTPRALIGYTFVDRVRFSDVDEAFARAEGDGDLANWRAIHSRVYAARCATVGTSLNDQTELLRFFFRRIYP